MLVFLKLLKAIHNVQQHGQLVFRFGVLGDLEGFGKVENSLLVLGLTGHENRQVVVGKEGIWLHLNRLSVVHQRLVYFLVPLSQNAEVVVESGLVLEGVLERVQQRDGLLSPMELFQDDGQVAPRLHVRLLQVQVVLALGESGSVTVRCFF